MIAILCWSHFDTDLAEDIRSDEIGASIGMGEQGLCMAAQCSGKNIKLSVEDCHTDYAVFCGKLIFIIRYHVYINYQNQMTCLSIKR
jgi:hypothetical protein